MNPLFYLVLIIVMIAILKAPEICSWLWRMTKRAYVRAAFGLKWFIETLLS